MTIIEQISSDLVAALKAGESEKLGVLRLVQAAIKNEQIKTGHDLSDDEARRIIKKEMEQHEESARFAEQAEREETAKAEHQAAAVLKAYLPAEISDEELSTIIDGVLAQTEDKSFGPLMGKVMGAVAGRASGDRVRQMLQNKLNT